MKQQFLFVAFALVLLYDATFAQITLCGMAVRDNATRNCAMKNGDSCNKIMMVVTGFPGASGYGASISSRISQKGEFVECHIETKKSFSWLTCREYYKINGVKLGEMYRMDLGNPKHIDSVMIAISKRMVKITANKHSNVAPMGKTQTKSDTMKAKVPYVIDAILPIREESGFSSQPKLHYKVNGLLKRKGNRKSKGNGAGYMASTYISPP